MSLRAGTVLDHRYALIERLGEGGQGSVWKAFDKNTGADRALKVVHLPSQDREAAERARREAHLVKDARHPAVVACHSLFEIPPEDVLVLVFDFVQATPLSEVIGDARFDRTHRLAVLRHIAGALAFLHGRGVVHRDLKPDNILVTPVFWEDPAAPSSLKIIDFGIAGPRGGEGGATLSGTFGTPPYMAPELFEVAGVEAQRSFTRDVFAFGVIGWELLAGGHPTQLPPRATAGAYRESYVYQRRSRDPWPPRPLEGRWGAVVTACLALDPGARPQDGRAILGMLDGEPETSPPAQVAGAAPEVPAAVPEVPVATPPPRKAVTDEHVAPPPEPVLPPPEPVLPPPEPTVPPPPPAAEPTEIAPVAALPRGSRVERTTPMIPEVVYVAPAPSKAPPAQPLPPSPPRPERPAAPVSAVEGTWQLVAMAVALLLLVAGGTAWLLLGKGCSGSGTAGSPSASGTGTGALHPAPTTVWLAPPTSSATTATSVQICCPRGEMRCPSERPCKTEGCTALDGPAPEGEFVPRIIKVEEEPSPYEKKRNLADPKALPNSTVCVRSAAGEACTSMREIASAGGSRLDHTLEGKERAALRVSTAELRKSGLRLRIRNKGKWVHDVLLQPTGGLKANALCVSLKMQDEGARFFLIFYLDDPPD